MKTMKAGEFKAKCLKVMDQVSDSGDPVVITKHGKAVAQLVPMTQKPKTLFGAMAGEIEISGDIISPIEGEWDAVRGDER